MCQIFPFLFLIFLTNTHAYSFHILLTLVWPPNTGVMRSSKVSLICNLTIEWKQTTFLSVLSFFVTWLSNSWNRDFGQKYYSCLVNWWTSSELVSRGSQGYILYLRSTQRGEGPSLISPTLLVLLGKWLSTAHLLNANCWQSRFTGRHFHYQDAENIFLLLSWR